MELQISPTTKVCSGDDSPAALLAMYRSAIRNRFMLDAEEPNAKDRLDEVRSWALAEVQRLRGEARKAYVPDVPGQELMYANKLRQAQDFLAAKKPIATDYPSLSGKEARVRSLSVDEMAELIAERASDWQVASDRIDAAALSAKQLIESALSVDDIVTTLVAEATSIGR